MRLYMKKGVYRICNRTMELTKVWSWVTTYQGCAPDTWRLEWHTQPGTGLELHMR